jgi:hypothetical protein
MVCVLTHTDETSAAKAVGIVERLSHSGEPLRHPKSLGRKRASFRELPASWARRAGECVRRYVVRADGRD